MRGIQIYSTSHILHRTRKQFQIDGSRRLMISIRALYIVIGKDNIFSIPIVYVTRMFV